MTTNITFSPKKASEKALSYCSDFISAEDQLKRPLESYDFRGWLCFFNPISCLQKYLLWKGPHVRIM